MYAKYFKVILDIVFSTLILLGILPFLFVIFVLIKLDGGPALFFHNRIGKDGQKIRVIKLRTMVVNAEEKLQDLLNNDENIAEEWAKFHKLKNDPRITKIGKILRKTHFDEIPQFFNVILGQMSVIGPRPLTREEFNIHFLSEYNIQIYQSVKPGITGAWQTNGELCGNFQERIELEISYINNINIIDDMLIFIMTFKKIFSAKST